MASGGARTRSGPPPDPNALRRDRDQGEWVTLPAEGRDGAVPEWPLPDPLSREIELWEREWRRPQAVMWEQNHQQLEVAMYVRAVLVADGPKATAADRNVVQRKMNDLGLTVPGLRANRWRIGTVEAKQAAGPTAPKGRRSTKERLKLVQGEAS